MCDARDGPDWPYVAILRQGQIWTHFGLYVENSLKRVVMCPAKDQSDFFCEVKVLKLRKFEEYSCDNWFLYHLKESQSFKISVMIAWLVILSVFMYIEVLKYRNNKNESICTTPSFSLPRVRHRTVLVDNFFEFSKLSFFCFVAYICDLAHDVKVIQGLC